MNTLTAVIQPGAVPATALWQGPWTGQVLDALLRSSLLLLVAWAGYRFLLRDTRWFRLNRAVLLGIVAATALVPWLPLRSAATGIARWFRAAPQTAEPVSPGFEALLTGFMLPTVTASVAEAPGWGQVFLLVWALGVAFFAGVFLRDLGRVFARLRATRPAMLLGQRVRLGQDNDSFSFGPAVVIGRRDAEDPDRLAAVLAHERAHSRQGHSLDVLMAELLRVLLWFHPAAWWLRGDIAENAEFLADRAAVEATTVADREGANAGADRNAGALSPASEGRTAPGQAAFARALNNNPALPYARRLIEHQLANLQGHSRAPHAASQHSLVHAFHQHQLKRRIDMLTHTKTPRARLLRYAAVLTIASTAIVACASEAEQDIQADARMHSGTHATPMDSIYMVTDEPAEFPGGMEAMIAYLSEEITYPAEAKKAGVQGKTFVQFVVDPDGRVVRTKVVKGFFEACDAEALRVVEAMPDWQPAKMKGEPVAMQMTLPIAFVLPPKSE